MKFIHTADISLDRCYAEQYLPAHVARENRAHLRTRLQAILDHASTSAADGILITGNLLDFESFDRDTIGFLREAFEGVAPIPVLISPGNMDPFVSTSPYATELWPENVHIFSTPTWTSVPVGDVSVYGFGYDGREISRNPFESFEFPEDDRPFIIMGHARTTAHHVGDGAGMAVADLNQLAHRNLAYVALGFERRCLDAGVTQAIPAWYAGAPEGGSFDESGPHHVLEVNLVPPVPNGRPVARISPMPVSQGRFFQMALDCTDLDSGQALIDALRPHLAVHPDCQCARIILEGALLPEIYDEMSSIRDVLAEELLFLDLVDRCYVAENFEELALQKTSLGAFVERINLEIQDAPDESLRTSLCRSRDLALCAYRGQHMPIRASQGD